MSSARKNSFVREHRREHSSDGPLTTPRSYISLLPSVFAGYLPTVDLDAAVAALAPRLVAYATGRTGCPCTGEDVAQDALTALVVRWQRHGPPESPEAFAFASKPADILRVLAMAAGLTVEVSSSDLGPVTLTLTNVRLRTALDAICDTAACAWKPDGTTIKVTSSGTSAASASERSQTAGARHQ
jgi:hypothetical protein